MSIKKVIEIDVDVLNANGGLDNLKNSFKEVENSTKTLKQQLKEAVQEVQQLSQQYGETSKEAINAAKRAAELKDRIEDTNDAILAFKGEGTFLATSKALAGVASGFGAVQGAMGLLGTENKDLERQLLKVQSAMALADGLAGLEDTGRAFKQLGAVVKSNAVIQGLYATAVGVSTGAMKVFRLALVATGIGALVVGLGLLIANFDKVKKAVMDFVPGLALVGEFIGNLVEDFTDFIGVTSEAERALDKMRESADKSLAMNKKYLEQQGDQLDEFTKKKIEAKNKYLEALKDESNSEKDRVALAKRLNRELASIENERINERNEKRQAELEKINKQNQEQNEKAKAEREKLRKEDRDNLNASAKELQDARDKIEAERQKKEAELKAKAKEIQERLIEESKPELSEREALEAKYQMEYDLLVSANESTLALQSKYTSDVLALNDKERQQRIKDAEDEKLRTQAVSDAKIDIAKNTLNLVAEIAGRGSKIGKAIAIAQATISGIEGTQNAFTTASKSPITTGFPAYPFIQAGLAGAFSLLQIKKIASTNTSGGGGAPSIGGSAGGGGGAQAPSFNVVGNSGVNQIAQTLNQQHPPIQAYVVANNVTTAQSANRNIIENASLG